MPLPPVLHGGAVSHSANSLPQMFWHFPLPRVKTQVSGRKSLGSCVLFHTLLFVLFNADSWGKEVVQEWGFVIYGQVVKVS